MPRIIAVDIKVVDGGYIANVDGGLIKFDSELAVTHSDFDDDCTLTMAAHISHALKIMYMVEKEGETIQ